MPQATGLAEFLRDLQQLEKAAAQHHGQLILDAFCRHTPYSAGAVWLRDGRGAALQLAARSPEFDPPPDVGEIPRDVSMGPHVLIPIRSHRESLGLIALTPAEASAADLDSLRAASAFLSSVMTNHRLVQEMREGDFQLKYRLWELESLYDIGLSIAATLNMDDLADEILARMISLINARRAGLFLREGDRFRLFRSFGEIGLSDADLLGIVTAHGAVTLENGALAALPIVGNNSTIGVLAIGDRETRDGVGPFEQNDLRLLSLFASQVAIAIENARLHKEALEKQAMQRDLELAATIQRDILPKAIPDVEGIEIATLARPARQVGGDYHAFVERDGVLTLLVADVAGKSMPAALLVSALHAAVQLLFAEGRGLGEIATELNKHLHRWSADNKFVTMVMASIDREAQTIEYVNAGHNPCYIVISGSFELMRSHGLPIGIMGNSRYLPQTRPFPPGSTVVLYSDGITEAANVGEEEFGNERLEGVMRASLDGGAAAVRDAIAKAVDAFTAGAAQYDDQTLVVAKSC
ncbi:MAG TPA: SpoIIE family protein phosphatase [Thermoanaerobaculia bacterium]|nr:SpoIIE family protein phosphatase [Thermoanaerobaculia bacterium]